MCLACATMQEPQSPKMSPAWIASLIAIVAIVGAVAVFLLAKATHLSDQQQIADYDRATLVWFSVADEAIAAMQRGEPYDAERLSDAVNSIAVLSTPGILDPLHERDVAWLELVEDANRIVSEDGNTGEFKETLRAALAAREDADRERDEIHCASDPARC